MQELTCSQRLLFDKVRECLAGEASTVVGTELPCGCYFKENIERNYCIRPTYEYSTPVAVGVTEDGAISCGLFYMGLHALNSPKTCGSSLRIVDFQSIIVPLLESLNSCLPQLNVN
jgi:hypothetical protein